MSFGRISFVDDVFDCRYVLVALVVEPIAYSNETASLFSEHAGGSTVTGSMGLGDFHVESGAESGWPLIPHL